MEPLVVIGAVVLALTVLGLGFFLGWMVNSRHRRNRLESAQEEAARILADASSEAESLSRTAALEAKDEWRREREPLERELENSRRSLRELESNLLEREQQLDRKVDILESKERSLLKTEQQFDQREAKIAEEEARTRDAIRQQRLRLEELAGISTAEARKMLIEKQEESARQYAARRVKEIKDHGVANANREAREIITHSIQRFAGELAMESTVSVVQLPSDEMKGRIIGRDGRNIRSFDMITGVEVIVDDTPAIVMLSSFDPFRREVAKNTLEKLILDGRIHPGRIEEIYEKCLEDAEELIRESGSKAAFDLGIHDMAELLLEHLGKLRFRTSYGQNLLVHSKEVGFLAGMMAEELEMDASLARRAGLLHDIAKALDRDISSDPAQASGALARKCSESAEVAEVIETHTRNQPGRTAVAILVQAANEISSGRPGALKERVQDYTQRMHHMEELALNHPGVNRAYALQNGKEVRIIVDSETVDDGYSDQLADEITHLLEEELGQHGQIKVVVIREVRAVHYAR
ncbi:MAG: ribonuclease Y [Candidatus Latescibacterota bacterium]|nr:ribonuclease Y [Candidatus Latescibacterota bacterium]